MKRILLALDLDGTLLNSNLEISPVTKRRLLEFSKAGHYITIATGRPVQSTLKYARELDIQLPLIMFNGALVATVDSKPQHSFPVDGQAAKDLISFCRENHLPCSVFSGSQIFMLREDLFAKKLHQTHDFTNPTVYPKLEKKVDEYTSNIVITLETGLEPVYTSLKKSFGKKLQVVRSGNHFIDVLGAGVSKGKSLAILAQSLGIEQENIIAVGDNHNDLEMLKYAGLGVAMAEADSLVKETADYVTDSNDQDGIAKLLDKIAELGCHKALA